MAVPVARGPVLPSPGPARASWRHGRGSSDVAGPVVAPPTTPVSTSDVACRRAPRRSAAARRPGPREARAAWNGVERRTPGAFPRGVAHIAVTAHARPTATLCPTLEC
eukprot:4006826-Prymnesium_polylepis.1